MNITYTTTRTITEETDGFADIMAGELSNIMQTVPDYDTAGAQFTDLFRQYTGCTIDVATTAYKEMVFQYRCEPIDVFNGVLEGVLIGMALANGNVKGTA